jgi:hypothetical protein
MREEDDEKALTPAHPLPATNAIRSAPLPIKLDGFSVGAVIGFSETLTMVAFTTDTDIDTFKKVRGQAVHLLAWQGT